MENTFFKFDATLKTPFSLIAAGPSTSGKTTFVIDLIKNKNGLIDTNFDYILWFYGETQPFDSEIINNNNIKFIKGLPEEFDSYIDPTQNGLAIFDDLMEECGNNKLISNFFTRKTHHQNISIIFITQNLYSSGKERKTCSRNSTYLAIFNSPLDSSIAYSLARQIMPKNQRTFLDIYEHAVEKPHGYLFIDGHQKTPKIARLKSDILNNFQKVFIPLKKLK